MPSTDALHYPGNEQYRPGTWLYLLSENPEKRKGEIFFWKFNLCWLIFFATIVITGVYEYFDKWSYLYVGLSIAIPGVFFPILFPSFVGEENTKFSQRYTTKANIWIVIYSFVGNYFWTHYFYKVLGCSYLLDAHRINDVPICMFLITVGYFHLYHATSSILLRKLWRAVSKKSITTQYIIVSALVAIGCYITAVVEVATIASFPYYTYPDTKAMFIIGSGFYGIYFIGSFPSFLRIDEYIGKAQYLALEKKNDRKSVNAQDVSEYSSNLRNEEGFRFSFSDTVKDVLAYCMYTTIFLDLWRITIGQVNGEVLDNIVSFIY